MGERKCVGMFASVGYVSILSGGSSKSTVVMKLCECVGDLETELVHGMVWNSYFTWGSL